MFFKKLEFTKLISWESKTSMPKPAITLAASLAAAAVLLGALINLTGIFLRSALFALSFFFLAYWTVSIFVYLYKKGQYGVFTRIIQRFWKRTLWLFWLLELFLFFIYLFLAVISPQEVAYMLDNSQLIFDSSFNLKPFFISTLNALIIILLFNVRLLLHKYNALAHAVNGAVFILLLRAVTEDFLQFYGVSGFYSNSTWVHTRIESSAEQFQAYFSKATGVWEQENAELKCRTITHYIYLLIFLKLWHTVFIFFVFVFLENITLRTGSSSHNVHAANLQNFYFLMFFNYILKITLAKAYFNYLGTYVFYWFFINFNSYDLTYFYNLTDSGYFLFICQDLF